VPRVEADQRRGESFGQHAARVATRVLEPKNGGECVVDILDLGPRQHSGRNDVRRTEVEVGAITTVDRIINSSVWTTTPKRTPVSS
jgi:hypothetical protein